MKYPKSVFLCFLSLFLLASTPNQDAKPTILISEFVYNPFQQDELYEWIELLIISETPIEAEQYKLGDEETIGGGEGFVRFPKGTILEPNQVIVIAQSAVDFKADVGIFPHFELQDSTPDVPNMRPVSLLASGDIMLANSGDEIILLNERNQPVDRVNYGESTAFMNPSIQTVGNGYSLERFPPNCDTDLASDFRPLQDPSPLLVPDFGVCEAKSNESKIQNLERFEQSKENDQSKIGSIQGEGSTSPRINQFVTFQGIVTAISADKNASGITFYTIFVQDQDDGNPGTSDALPVFTARERPNVKPGDLIEVTGKVEEFFGLTEVVQDDLKIEILERNLSHPDSIELSLDRLPAERLEGMLVSLPEAIVAGPAFETDAGCGFSIVPVGVNLPIVRQSAEDDVSMIIPVLPQDDRDCAQLPNVKKGDKILGLTGPLTWNFDQWKIVQSAEVKLQIIPGPRLPLPQKIRLKDQQFSIATLNLENQFDSIDDTGDDAEPKLSSETIAIREEKFSHLISEWMGCPTLIGIQEVENIALLESLASTIELECGFRYDIAHRESYDGRGIDNALLVHPNRSQIISVQLKQTCTRLDTKIEPRGFDCPSGEQPLFSRPPLEVTLLLDESPLTVYVNHFKSKRGGELETASRRQEQAEHLVHLVTKVQEDGQENIVVIGDFN
ncbi:MAG: lamin tail domain-containing protein, partial [Chloroflexota bacterium]